KAGDGRVPHALGLLDGVRTTYYVRCAHGDLARNPSVLGAIDDLVKAGTTKSLLDKVPDDRAIPVDGPQELHRQWAARFTTEEHRKGADQLGHRLRRLDRHLVSRGPAPATAPPPPLVSSEEGELEERVLRPFLGSGTDAARAPEPPPAPPKIV